MQQAAGSDGGEHRRKQGPTADTPESRQSSNMPPSAPVHPSSTRQFCCESDEISVIVLLMFDLHILRDSL